MEELKQEGIFTGFDLDRRILHLIDMDEEDDDYLESSSREKKNRNIAYIE